MHFQKAYAIDKHDAQRRLRNTTRSRSLEFYPVSFWETLWYVLLLKLCGVTYNPRERIVTLWVRLV